ncbi:MAG: pseudouridine synthase [Deinococcales bacterium]
MPERLQKLLARSGVASRRAAEKLLLEGRVQVNGVVATLGQSARSSDLILVDGQRLEFASQHVSFMLYKPRGIVTSASDEYGRQNVLELVPEVAGLHPVGRLDRASEGLLILTTDGNLTLHLTHPRYHHPKEYRVWTDPEPNNAQLEALWAGVELEDGFAKPNALEAAVNGFRMVLLEGRKHQVRRMAAAVGLKVLRLMRTRISNLVIGDLRPGEWRELGAEDLELLT